MALPSSHRLLVPRAYPSAKHSAVQRGAGKRCYSLVVHCSLGGSRVTRPFGERKLKRREEKKWRFEVLNGYLYAAFPIKRCLTFTFIHCWLLQALSKRLLIGNVPKWGRPFLFCALIKCCFLNVCISAGHTLWEGLAEFGTIVVPRIVFRSPVVVTGSPPSSNHYIRTQGRWWISLWMKMVRWC